MTRLLTAILPLLISVSAAQAGHAEGNGGIALVCRDATTDTRVSAEVLDLVVGRESMGLPPLNLDSLPETIRREFIHGRLARLVGEDRAQTFLQEQTATASRMRFVSQGFGLVNSEDGGIILVPPSGCQYEQLALYTGDGLLVNREIYDLLTATHRQAFLFHETAYTLARRTRSAPNSVTSQRVTAALFAQTMPPQALNLLEQAFELARSSSLYLDPSWPVPYFSFVHDQRIRDWPRVTVQRDETSSFIPHNPHTLQLSSRYGATGRVVTDIPANLRTYLRQPGTYLQIDYDPMPFEDGPELEIFQHRTPLAFRARKKPSGEWAITLRFW